MAVIVPTAIDTIEQALIEIEEKLMNAWRNNRCLTCPIGGQEFPAILLGQAASRREL